MSNTLPLDNTEIKIKDKMIVGVKQFDLTYKEDVVGELSVEIDDSNTELIEIRYVQINPNFRKQGLLTSLVDILLYNGFTLYGEVDEVLDEVEDTNARQVWIKLGAVFEYEYTWVIVNDKNK